MLCFSVLFILNGILLVGNPTNYYHHPHPYIHLISVTTTLLLYSYFLFYWVSVYASHHLILSAQ